ncbi:MAG: glycosyltransferase [Candidatus Planktophila sp.]|nr:glycosyltransferase [Candidatus Planktophila sp.]
MNRMLALRISIVASALLGTTYVTWRWLFSLNMSAWWIAVPLVVCETYSIIDSLFFSMTVWRAKTRPAPPVPPIDFTVDVFITTYNEPIEMVMRTAVAAQKIRYPHKTWVLDDGAREELLHQTQALGIGYVSRGTEWKNRPRHAKAGNVNNALMQTTGELILILDADQVPAPEILDHTLGYFLDDRVALVQTPQTFGNVSIADPLGSQAPLFYGPIQQGKDGWGAAYFCGSNAVLRREALMQLGVKRYVIELEAAIKRSLNDSGKIIKAAKKKLTRSDEQLRLALDQILGAVVEAQENISNGKTLGEATFILHDRIKDISHALVFADLDQIKRDLDIIGIEQSNDANWAAEWIDDLEDSLDGLSTKELSPLAALSTVMELLKSLDVDRSHEAIPIMPIATISITEDMATSMRLHGMKWKSVYHHETLAIGLAPEDMSSMLTQRLRWAQGTMQVFLKENPLFQKGMTVPQKLMYFSTMWSYFSGFAALFYFAAPIIFLCFGILPVRTDPVEFFLRFIPFMIANQLIFLFASRGISTWRGQQYSYALFPVWIKATASAIANVYFKRPMTFVVTPKTRNENSPNLRLIYPQLIFIAAFVISLFVGIARYATGLAPLLATLINMMWVLFDLSLLRVLFPAILYQGSDSHKRGSHGNLT